MTLVFGQLITDVNNCTLCESHLPAGIRPVLQLQPSAKVLIIGQAPGRKVHASGIPFEDASGDRLREWMGVDREIFYDSSKIAIMPMGFCYPGKGKSGDLPPRPECAPKWHAKLLNHLPELKLTLLIGHYAQNYYLKDKPSTLTATVQAWRNLAPNTLPLPHPSPRNNIWLKRNSWFAQELIPELQGQVAKALS